MTLVLPGSAQMAAGNKRVGRIALRAWAVLVAAVIVTAILGLVWRSAFITLLSSSAPLRILQVLLVLVGICWALLMIDAWRISRPPELARKHRLGFAMLSTALAFMITGALFASASIVSSQRDFMASVFAGGGDSHAKAGRINVLLLGGDAGKDRVGLRPDSMTIASIDVDSGRTVLFSLPRNMEDVPFPASSPLHKKFPNGYGCADHSCMLNAVYTYAMAHKDLYPGVRNPGAQATKEAAEGATGLKINYYALVDLKGFQKLIDAVGGITLTVNKRLPIGGQVPGQKVKNYIEPGKQHMDGFHALWYARSRHADSDYARMARQKCVMNAMLNQLDPVTVLTKFNKIAKAGKQVMETDVPPSQINKLIELAGKAKQHKIASVAFVPPTIYPGSPNFALMHRLTNEAVTKATDEGAAKAKAERKAAKKKAQQEKAQQQKSGAPSSGASSPASTSSPTGSSTSSAPSRANTPTSNSSAGSDNADDSQDLTKVCSA
ncbi:LytR family transcriptional regulator [Microlunatus elymi]|uniref:LytR family transcriptional regulator n=2 Tax=Microlunatus elymi TaxID=2596828 RepID=A0A516Q5L0_9ACTN|nr:LytR family transcriptional regulator [Microlunatus elymi]